MGQLMLTAGINDTQVARAIGCSRQSVVYWRTGRHLPNRRNREQLEGIFLLPFEELTEVLPEEVEAGG
jgi:DNA-binding XRE family transcriptional regulator